MSITILEIASLTGVSKSTVHRALSGSDRVSEDIRRLVLDCAERHQYRPNISARVLVGARTYLVAVLCSDFGNIHFAHFLRGVSKTARDSRYHLLTVNSLEELKNLTPLGMEGVISFYGDAAYHNEPQFEGLPTVKLIKEESPVCEGGDYISGRLSYGAGLMMRYLFEQGHRRIGHITLDQPGDRGINMKFTGYRNALRSIGLEYDPELVAHAEFYLEESGYEGAMKLLRQKNPPTAIFALADILAAGCYRAAQELGLRVPEDISICGYDDKEYSSFLRPPLTTISTPYNELGQRAMEMLVRRIDKLPPVTEEPILPELVIRNSVYNIAAANNGR